MRKLRLLPMRPRLPLVPQRMLLKLQLRKKEAKLVAREERKCEKSWYFLRMRMII